MAKYILYKGYGRIFQCVYTLGLFSHFNHIQLINVPIPVIFGNIFISIPQNSSYVFTYKVTIPMKLLFVYWLLPYVLSFCVLLLFIHAFTHTGRQRISRKSRFPWANRTSWTRWSHWADGTKGKT